MHTQMIFGVYDMNYTRLIYARMDCVAERCRSIPCIHMYTGGIQCRLDGRGVSWDARRLHTTNELEVFSRSTYLHEGFVYGGYSYGFVSRANVARSKQHAWGINYEHT